MDEADRLSDSIQIIDHGKIIASGTADSLKNTLGEDMIYLETKDDDKALQVARGIVRVSDARKTSKGVELILSADGGKIMPDLLKTMDREGIGILSVRMKKPSLDDVFVHYTGRELRDAPAENGRPTRHRGH
jgi:ABC-2 type transport system ATP-binding protein